MSDKDIRTGATLEGISPFFQRVIADECYTTKEMCQRLNLTRHELAEQVRRRLLFVIVCSFEFFWPKFLIHENFDPQDFQLCMWALYSVEPNISAFEVYVFWKTMGPNGRTNIKRLVNGEREGLLDEIKQL